jgi:hypothetical protein
MEFDTPQVNKLSKYEFIKSKIDQIDVVHINNQ